MTDSSRFQSVFERVFDVIVCGSGAIGFSAAQALSGAGLEILLLDTSGDLLWESSRALENRADDPTGSPAWSDLLRRLEGYGGLGGGFFDVALAEVLVASDLERSGKCSTMLYAMPVAARTENSLLAEITVATKSGPRRLRARQWVDASERGLLALRCLPDPESFRREPSTLFRSLVLQSAEWGSADVCPLPGAEWLPSVRESERRLRWPAKPGVPWHEDMLVVIRRLRETLTVRFLVSHASQCDFPVYGTAPAGPTSPVPANLLVLSPVFSHRALDSIADRFGLGASAPASLSAMPSSDAAAETTAVELPDPVEEWSSQVLVAGTGTSGVLAALAASAQNAETLAIDFATFPGGIGTEGGISKYCQGQPGGMQGRLDELTAEFSRLLVGSGSFGSHWHPLGKRLAILTLFAESGVRFLGEVLLCGVEKSQDGRVNAVLCAVDGRPVRIRANTFVDSTGDGDLCALAGADFSQGRPEDGVCLAFSQVGIALRKTEGGFSMAARNYDAGWVDPTDAEDLSRARLRGLAQYLRPAWTDEGRPFTFSSSLGIRQSRQIHTDLSVSFDDLVGNATFPDSIGGTLTFADTHAVDFEFEADESLFYYWLCQAFRELLQCELPYRMLLPAGLTNVWIACRAAGIAGSAAYGIRMQRDMQRLGEAAGTAAALVSGTSGESRGVDLPRLQGLLRASGACQVPRTKPAPDVSELQALLESGRPGFHFWQIYRRPEDFRGAVGNLLSSPDPAISFHAAALLAMWGSADAEPRLIAALRAREEGPPPTCGKGAFAQDVDIPYWLLATVLLRRCGTSLCLAPLREIASEKNLPFNVRTCLALTLERIGCESNRTEVVEILEVLSKDASEGANLPPTRSVRRSLDGKPQLVLTNAAGADTRENQSWQLHLVIARTRSRLGLPLQPGAAEFFGDGRSYVRRAFKSLPAAETPVRS